MTVDWLVVGIGILLGSTGYLLKRQKGHYNFLYMASGLLIVIFGLFS
jgi:sulfite exporter TauE/SafE